MLNRTVDEPQCWSQWLVVGLSTTIVSTVLVALAFAGVALVARLQNIAVRWIARLRERRP